MVRLIMGAAGAGKTKQLIELINGSVASESGSVVCIEPGTDMTYDVSHNVRLVNAAEYGVNSYDRLRGFVSGLYAGNYDISHIFIDNLLKIVKDASALDTENFLKWMDSFGDKCGIKFTVTVSADPETASEGMRRYM